jgi:hypothetical protein
MALYLCTTYTQWCGAKQASGVTNHYFSVNQQNMQLLCGFNVRHLVMNVVQILCVC